MVEMGKLNRPIDIGALGMDGIEMEMEDLSNLIEELMLLIFAGDGHNILLGNCHAVD